MKFTRIPENTFQKLQLNAGVLATDFTPSTGTIEEDDLIGATSGGITFTATPTYTDFGEDIDNCPNNMMELKVLDTWEVTMSGSLVTMDTTAARLMMGAADIDGTDATKVTPRADVYTTDYGDVWLVGDYSDENGDDDGGFVAVRIMNALSTGGFSMTTTDDGKGTFEFEFTGHYSMSAQDTPPFEIYIQAGGSGE